MSDLRARLVKILILHGKALSEAVGQREPESKDVLLSAKDLVQQFANADPMPGKSRTQWMVKTYIADNQFKLEDLGRATAALEAFERFKRKLPREQRELSQLTSLRDLEALVDPFVKAEERARLTRDLSSVTGRDKRRLECVKARDESIVIQEGKGLPTIAVPMTEFSSKWWGRGTKWCTAAENSNAFARYHQEAPLIVIICFDGEKFQMHVKTHPFLFMDNTDKRVSKEIIQERWNEFQSLLYWAVERSGLALKYVPEEHQTPELYQIAVEQNGIALGYVPDELRTPELCRIAVEQNGLALQFVPENKRSPELCRLAVQQNWMALKFVSEDQKTLEFCKQAIQRDGRALKFVPEEYKTIELCRLAIEQNVIALGDVPKKYKSALYRLAIEQNGLILSSIPVEHKTEELCRLAVEQNGGALQFLPREYKTLELCRLAIRHGEQILYCVPEEFKTPEFLALIPSVDTKPSVLTVHPTWHPDILLGLYPRNQSSLIEHKDDKALPLGCH
jgi:Domain of unknown function (DUF4116)